MRPEVDVKTIQPPTQSRDLLDLKPTSVAKSGENRWETYWRAGYTVAGAPPVLVDEYPRTHELARKTAVAAAGDAAKALAEAHVLLEVTPWVQPWQVRSVRTVENYEWQHLEPVKPSSIDVENGVVRVVHMEEE